METLVFLALIPFALAGLVILVSLIVGVTWFLAPVLLFLAGLAVFLALHQDGQHPVYSPSGLGMTMMVGGIILLYSRFKKD